MVYVRDEGNPDLFITLTCNAKWREFRENLFRYQKAQDRYDLVARVFKRKVDRLLDFFVKGRGFGKVKCYVYAIEWQKRGLPHVHLLIWFRNRIRPEQIDQFVCAEIPDPVTDPVLYGIVTKHMVHGPCGAGFPNSPCMDGQNCTKRYPRPFCNQTVQDGEGYPRYRRRSPRDGGHTKAIHKRRNKVRYVLDNWNIVPYNPTLCRMFDAHVNVEFVHSVKVSIFGLSISF